MGSLAFHCVEAHLVSRGSRCLALVFQLGSRRARLRGVLIKTDDIPRRVPESRGNLWRVHADRLHDLTAIRDHRINRRSHAVNHYVNQKAGLCGGRVADHPAATHFAGRYFPSFTHTGPSDHAIPDASTSIFASEPRS